MALEHEIQYARDWLEEIATGNLSTRRAIECVNPNMRAIVSLLDLVCTNMRESALYARALASGNLQAQRPRRRNFLSQDMRMLHDQLLAAQKKLLDMAQGDLGDREEDFGALSVAFDRMIAHARKAEQECAREPQGEQGAETIEVPAQAAGDMMQTLEKVLQTLPQYVFIVAQNNEELLFANNTAQALLRECGWPGVLRMGSLPQVLIQPSADVPQEAYCTVSEQWFAIEADTLPWRGGESAWLYICTDISSRKTRDQNMREVASIDVMTGLLTRQAGLDRLARELGSLQENTLSVAILDVDQLKVVNDNYGHGEGDLVLRTIARLLKASIRNKDVAARLGGDEFLVIFPSCPRAYAKVAMERMRNNLRKLNTSRDKPYSVSFTFGIVEIRGAEGEMTVTQVLQRAQERLFLNQQEDKL